MDRPLPRLLATALGVTLVVTAAACAQEADPSPRGGPAPTEAPTGGDDHLVSGDGWRGALLVADVGGIELPDGTWLDDVESFRPTEDDARRFEDALPAALATASNPSGEPLDVADLDDYVRQYTGVEGGGQRHLVVVALCSPDDFPDWENHWIEVSDGGACFWDATMDLATGEILRVSVHGQA
jgi:hypothetical protein